MNITHAFRAIQFHLKKGYKTETHAEFLGSDGISGKNFH